jgi:DNA-binding NarL/FixJ family response regulator
MTNNQNTGLSSPIAVHSGHPVVIQAIKRLLVSAPYCVKPFHQTSPPDFIELDWILIIDACSSEEWLEVALRWRAQGGRSIVILPDGPQDQEEELRLMYFGVRGIVRISNLENELAHAVDSVARDRWWFSRSTLDACATRTDPFEVARLFTVREEQIIALLLQAFSNKKISDILGITNRTVKFHVSNILHKFNVKNRKGLLKMRPPKTRVLDESLRRLSA